MPGEGVNHEVVVLHTLGRVAGARRILSPANDSQLAAAGAGSGAAGHAAGGDGDRGEAGAVPAAAFPLYEGGSMSEILEQAADATAACGGITRPQPWRWLRAMACLPCCSSTASAPGLRGSWKASCVLAPGGSALTWRQACWACSACLPTSSGRR